MHKLHGILKQGEKGMEKKSGFHKREILSHFLSAGINISPNVLEILSIHSLNTRILEDMIREISYIPGFKLHLTESILKQTSFFKNLNSNSKNIVTKRHKLDEKFPDLQKESASEFKKNLNFTANQISEASNLADEIMEYNEKKPQNRNNPVISNASITLQHPIVGGTNRFKPVAKDYAEQIEILKDPNSNLFTDGSINNFLALYRDRFVRLAEILSKNPEVKNIIPINQVKILQSSGPVNIIGMVTEKKSSRGGSAIKFSLEDQTGEIEVMVRKNEKNHETYESMNHLLNDQVVFVSGFLKVDLQYGHRIIYANKIIWPDIPLGYRSHIPSCPISFALVSDLHIGSQNFLESAFTRFIQYLNGEIGNEQDLQEAGKIKYLLLCGDLVDGIGIYADQLNELKIPDIYKQYEKAAELFAQIPDYIKIIYIPGNHEPVRKAIPHPSVPAKYCQPFLDLGVVSLGDPSLVELHGIKFLLYHGDGMIDLNNSIYGLPYNKPAETMKEMLRFRHLSPMHGKECTEKAPSSHDWLVIDQIPHVFHTGHMHINDVDHYRNVLCINSGCFQSQTKFMKSLGITPTPGKIPIISESFGKLKTTTLTLM